MKEKIYTLTNPITNDVFYVGRTLLPLNKRLTNHCTCNKQYGKLTMYIDELNELGVRPIIEQVDELDGFNKLESAMLESYWIQQFSAWGFELCNIRHVATKNYIPEWQRKQSLKSEKINRRVSFSGQEKEIVKLLYRGRKDTLELSKAHDYSEERFRQYMRIRVIPEWAKNAILCLYLERARFIYDWYSKNAINIEKQ